ncbi:MAG: formate dehydrogenase [Actinobacteria bacterium]|nr:formate dehydrogenase [Actinomycetota bacterium]
MKPVRVFVPKDSAAKSVGADDVARAISQEARARKVELEIVRTGSRGAMWLEPLVEVEVDGIRVAYGPMSAEVVPSLFDSQFYFGANHPLFLGLSDEIDWIKRQDRFTFARVGIVDPLSTDDYEVHGGMIGLRRALGLNSLEIVEEIVASGLRGRGGAGFPAGIKWRTVAQAASSKKYICCNADEGDSGTFADRMLMEGDPFTLIEGMTIAAVAVGADEGIIFIRSEYRAAIAAMQDAIDLARKKKWLGASILGSDFSFDIRIRVGAGSYICGEETAMLESIEGKRGVVRSKPPLPANEGLFGKPTLINNVLTLATVPRILELGADSYASRGVGRSLGTQVFQLSGNVARGGIVETSFGILLGDLVNDYGAGTLSARPVKAVQVGGPLGAYFPKSLFNVSMDYESLLAAGGMLGHGGVVIFDETVNMTGQAKFAMEFCAEESCGKCTPCRVGAVRGAETLHKISQGIEVSMNRGLLLDLLDVMADGSLCAMGGLTPLAVRSAMLHFAEDFESEGGD